MSNWGKVESGSVKSRSSFSCSVRTAAGEVCAFAKRLPSVSAANPAAIHNHHARERSGSAFNVGFDSMLADRLHKCPVITFVLVGILDREFADRVIEDVARTHVARDHSGIAGAGMRTRESPRA